MLQESLGSYILYFYGFTASIEIESYNFPRAPQLRIASVPLWWTVEQLFPL